MQGKLVIETTGNRLGKAKELAFGLDGTTLLVVEKEDGSETQLPISKVSAVGEFIVVRSESLPGTMGAPTQVPPPPAVVPPPVPTPTCRICGAALKPNARFCTRCGTAVA